MDPIVLGLDCFNCRNFEICKYANAIDKNDMERDIENLMTKYNDDNPMLNVRVTCKNYQYDFTYELRQAIKNEEKPKTLFRRFWG